MQKLYLALGLIFSLSLSGMKLGTGELVEHKKIDYTIYYRPVGGYLKITPHNKHFYQETLTPLGITLKDNDKVISVQVTQQTDKNNKNVIINFKNPQFLPLSVFTKNQTYSIEKDPASTKRKLIVNLVANGARQVETFYSHEELLKYIPQDNNNNNQSYKNIAAEDAKRLQAIWDNNPIALISTSAISPKEEKFQNNPVIDQNRETIYLSRAQINLCEAIKNMYDACSGDEKIAYPLELGKEMETKILFELLDEYLLFNADNLENQLIKIITSRLHTTIQELKLEILIKVISMADYCRVVTKYEEKEILLLPWLNLEFLHRMKQLPHADRPQHLNSLNYNLQQDILKTFIQQEKLTELLHTYYTNLKKKAKVNFALDNEINNCINAAFSNDDKQINNPELTLEKALLVYDILIGDDEVSTLKVTDDLVTTPVKIVLDACNDFRDIIATNEKAETEMRLILDKIYEADQEAEKQKEQIKVKQEEQSKAAKIESNSWTEFLMSKKVYMPLTLLGALLTYLYYNPQVLQNYFPSYTK